MFIQLIFIIFHNGLFFAKFWQNGGGAVLLDVLEIQPVRSSHFQPFADYLKNVTPEASTPGRAEDWKNVKTSTNVPGTCSKTGECLQEVSTVYH